MTRRSPVPSSPAFEAIACGVQFRDRIAVVVKAPPEAIFQALYEVTLRDMKLAWLLAELRYFPSRLAGHMPAADSRQSFMKRLMADGTLILRDDLPHPEEDGSRSRQDRRAFRSVVLPLRESAGAAGRVRSIPLALTVQNAHLMFVVARAGHGRWRHGLLDTSDVGRRQFDLERAQRFGELRSFSRAD
jgi:hypothetical protein